MSNSIQPCLSYQTTLLRKRKRSVKTVRFDIEHIVIIDTYSASDYDRGSLFTTPIQYKINPAILAASIEKETTELSSKTAALSVEIPSSPCDSEASSPDSDVAPPTTRTISLTSSNDSSCHRRKKPKLTVDTSLCPGGPLFLTKLSTNHFKHRSNASFENEDQEDQDQPNSHDFLIPVTPCTPAATTTAAFF